MSESVSRLTLVLILSGAALGGCSLQDGGRDPKPPLLPPIPGTVVLPPDQPPGKGSPGGLPASQMAFRLEAIRAIDRNLLQGASAALAAYEPNAPSGWTRHALPRPALFGVAETVVLTRADPSRKTIEVSIRGTANLDDAVSDLNATAVLDTDLQIPLHTGFRSIAQGVIEMLNRAYPRSQLPDHTYSLYGHSLGGAVASIVSMYLHQGGLTVDKVVTFGAPRFTTNEGARKYQLLNQRTYRVVRCDDAVPFLPPPNFFGWSTGSYEANGNLLLLLAPPHFDYSIGIDIERDFMHQLREDLANAAKREQLAFGHRMDRYAKLIQSFGRDQYGMPVALRPVSYQLADQQTLCPARLATP
jgi:hypothetical protein